MIHNRQGINIPGRNLAVVSVLLNTKTLQENQVYEVKPNLLLTNEHPNLFVLPMLHLVQKEMHDSIPVALINLNEDERIFLKKGEILGCLEPSPIEITEIVKEEHNDMGEENEKDNESIPLEKKFITSPAEVNTHRKIQLQDAEVTEENTEKFRLLCKEFEDIFSRNSTDIGKTPLITMDSIGEFHLPSSKGNRYALTVICMFTGFTFCIPLPDKKAQTVLKAVHTGEILFHFH